VTRSHFEAIAREIKTLPVSERQTAARNVSKMRDFKNHLTLAQFLKLCGAENQEK
jgi:hypothetical protein